MNRLRWVLLVATALALAGCTTPDNTSDSTPEPTSSPSASSSPSGQGRFETVRRQLEADPIVVHQMLLTAEATGLFRCGMRVLRWDGQGQRLYVLLSCSDYRTGPEAKSLSGSSMPAVVDLAQNHGWLVMGVAFPRQWALEADYERMFPPGVRERARSGRLQVRPTEAEFLTEARSITS